MLGIDNVRFDNLDNTKPFSKAIIFHPRKSALIYSGNEQIGIVGFVNPKIVDNFELKGDLVAYELNFDLIANLSHEKVSYRKISNFPTVVRTISFWINEKVEVDEINKVIASLTEPLLAGFTVADIYRDNDHKGKKSIAMEFTLQSDTKTLTEEEVESVMKKIHDQLASKIQAEIRDSE